MSGPLRPPEPPYSANFARLVRAIRMPVVSHIPRTVSLSRHMIPNVQMCHETPRGKELTGHVTEVGSGCFANQLLEFPKDHQRRLEKIGIFPRVGDRCCLRIEEYEPTQGKVKITAVDEKGQRHFFYVTPGELTL